MGYYEGNDEVGLCLSRGLAELRVGSVFLWDGRVTGMRCEFWFRCVDGGLSGDGCDSS